MVVASDLLGSALAPQGSFTYVVAHKQELKKDFATFATILEFHEVIIDLKKLDPALFWIAEEKIGDKTYQRLTIAGPKDSGAMSTTRLAENMVLKGTPDFQRRDMPMKHDWTAIVFQSTDTAKDASKAFRRAAILSGAKESERDPFKD